MVRTGTGSETRWQLVPVSPYIDAAIDRFHNRTRSRVLCKPSGTWPIGSQNKRDSSFANVSARSLSIFIFDSARSWLISDKWPRSNNWVRPAGTKAMKCSKKLLVRERDLENYCPGVMIRRYIISNWKRVRGTDCVEAWSEFVEVANGVGDIN